MQIPLPSSPVRRFLRSAVAAALSALVVAQPVLADLSVPSRPAALPPIRLIQDIHAHPEAQRSIADLLGRLQKERGRDLRVGVEGAAGPFDFSPYYAFPDDTLRRSVARELLDGNRIAGPVYAALCRPVLTLVGIENAGLYRANVAAYLQARAAQGRLLAQVEDVQRDIERRKAAAFPKDLARFDAIVTGYRAGKATFGDYLEAVSAASNETDLALESFLAAHRMEKTLDFARVEIDRKRFVERLARSLAPNDVARVRAWIDGLADDAGAGRRYAYLFHAARSKGIDLAAFPALTDYVRYVQLAESVDAAALFSEAARAEDAAYAALCGQSSKSAALISEARRAHLTERLLKFEMTHEDWRAYQAARPAGTLLPAEDLKPFEDFYRVAARRDAELARLAVQGRLDAVVVGGFHTEGLTAALRAANVPFEISRPRISAVDSSDATAYLSVFAAERTPLERLFSRFKLFLAPPAVIGVAEPLVHSRNDDANARFSAVYRRLAVTRSELLPRIDAAADALARRQRPTTSWATETAFLLPLAIGLMTGDANLAAFGILFQLVGLPLAHADRAARFGDRAIWSAAFLGVYGGAFLFTVAAGMPVLWGAGAALLAPAAFHYLNHFADRFPGSAVAAVLFDRLRLPVLRMAIGEPDRDPSGIIRTTEEGMAAAIAAWRTTTDAMATSVMRDPVTEYIARIEASTAGQTAAHANLLIEGLARAIVNARLSIPEMRVRALRDHYQALMHGVDHTGDPLSENSGLTTLAYQDAGNILSGRGPENAAVSEVLNLLREAISGRMTVLGGGGPETPAAAAIRQARTDAVDRGLRDYAVAAIEAWRAGRSADLTGGDEKLKRLWSFGQGTENGGSFTQAVVAVAEGIALANLTPEEYRFRTRVDTRDRASVATLVPHPLFEAAVYVQLVGKTDTKKAPLTPQQQAIMEGSGLALRDAAAREFAKQIATWRGSGEVTRRDPTTILQFLFEVLFKQQREDQRLVSVVEGFSDAYVAADFLRDEAILRAVSDMSFSTGAWFDTNGSADRLVRSMLDVYASYVERKPEYADAVHTGLVTGFLVSVDRAAKDSIDEMRGVAREGSQARRPRPQNVVTLAMQAAAKFQMETNEIPRYMAAGFLKAEPTNQELATIVVQLMMPILEAPQFQEDVPRFQIAGSVATLLTDNTTGTANETVRAVLDEAFNTAGTLIRLLPEWKRSNGSDLNDRLMRVWTRLPHVRHLSPDSEPNGQDAIVNVMLAADLSEEQLRVRARNDLRRQIELWTKRDLVAEELVWQNKVMDPAMQAAIEAYVTLAGRYKEAGDPRAAAILNGLVDAFEPWYLEAGLQWPNSVYNHKSALGLQAVAQASLKLNEPDAAYRCGILIGAGLEPSYEMVEIIHWFYDVMGRSALMSDNPGRALEDGYEYSTAMAYRDLSQATLKPAEFAPFIEQVSNTGQLFLRVGAPTAAGAFFRFAINLLEKYPAVAAALAPNVENRLRAAAAAAAVGTTRDVDVLRREVANFDRSMAAALAGEMPVSEREAMVHEQMNVAVDACLLGDRSRLAQVTTTAAANYPTQPLLVANTLAHALRNLAIGDPANREAYIAQAATAFGTVPAASTAATLDDVVFISGYALFLAFIGRGTEAEKILIELDKRMDTPAFRAALGDTGPETPRSDEEKKTRANSSELIGRMRSLILTQLAGVMTLRSAPPAEIAVVLDNAFGLPGYDNRIRADIARFMEPGVYDEARLFDAITAMITAPDRKGAMLENRVRVAEWARVLNPRLARERMKAWTEETRFKAAGRAIKERMALLDSIGDNGFPGNVLILLDHEKRLAEMRGADVPRVFMNTYAGVLAAIGLGEQSLATIRESRKISIAQSGRKGQPVVEDMGIINFPYFAGQYAAVIEEAQREVPPQSGQKFRILGPIVMNAAERIGEQDNLDAKKLTRALEMAGRLIESYRPLGVAAAVGYVMSRIVIYTGNFRGARDAAQRAAAEAASGDGDAAYYATRAMADLAALTMRDQDLSLVDRLDRSEEYARMTQGREGFDAVYIGYLELVVALFRYNPGDPGAAAALARRAIEVLRTAEGADDIGSALGYGLAIRMAEAAVLCGPASSGELVDALAGLEAYIGRATESIPYAIRMARTMATDPAGFLAWMDAQPNDGPSAPQTAMRLAAAHRAGDATRAMAEAERLVNERPEQFSDAYWVTYIPEILMESPILRSSYLETVKAALTSFTAEAWTGKERIETLRRLIEVAGMLGDPEILFLIDALNENKAFPLRDVLLRPNTGLVARMEPALDADAWIERITRMNGINPSRIKALEAQAEKRMATDADRERLGILLAEKRGAFDAVEQAKRNFTDAKSAYQALQFAAAQARIAAIPPALRTADMTAFIEKFERVLAIWSLYQGPAVAAPAYTGDDAAEKTDEYWAAQKIADYDAALEALRGFDRSDPAPLHLYQRIESMKRALEELSDHRPQAAELTLNAANGTMPDQQTTILAARVRQEYRNAANEFDLQLKPLFATPGRPVSVEAVARRLRSIFDHDSEYESVMRYIVERAQAYFDTGRYDLAQDLLIALARESRLFDPAKPGYSRFQDTRRSFERTRAVGRAIEMKGWLELQVKMLRTELEANDNALDRTRQADGGQGVEAQRFQLGTWEINESGVVSMTTLSREVPRKGGRDAGVALEPVNLGTQNWFQTGQTFQIQFPPIPARVGRPGASAAATPRPPITATFLRKDRTNKLLFSVDPSGADVMRQIARSGNRSGALRFVKDVSLLAQVSALDQTISYLDSQIGALLDDRSLSDFGVINRLLGLDISAQPHAGAAGVVPIDPRFTKVPSQLESIEAAVNPESVATAIQGPPGTGKTTTGVEIVRQLTQGTTAKRGRIVIITSQAHAGVDNIALRLRAANIPMIRSASQQAQSNVTKDLHTVEVETPQEPGVPSRLDQLMQAIETHYSTGAGFAYCATNSGLRGDRKCFELLNLYLSGEPMAEIRMRHAAWTKRGASNANDTRGETAERRRAAIRPVWGQEEAGQASAPEVLVVAWSVRPDKVFLFGDQFQLAPHGVGDETVRFVQREERQHRFQGSAGPSRKVFTEEANAALETSLFELAYAHAERWNLANDPGGAGLMTRFLAVARRSVWVITASIVNVFYDNRLQHRDQTKPERQWERIRKDTVVFVNSTGRETSANIALEHETQGSAGVKRDSEIVRSPSKVNFTEVGEVIRAATYHLNGRSPVNNRPRRPGDILILTPYRGQNTVINETLRALAILNDLAAGDVVSPDEIAIASDIFLRHARMANYGQGRLDELRRRLARVASGDRRRNVADILFFLIDAYDLRFDGRVQISRADLPEIRVETPGEEQEFGEQNQTTLDEQLANVIEAKTVHSVQGQERKVVIVSLVRSGSLGFLDDSRGQMEGRRIINVGLSRVEDQLVVIYSQNRHPNSIGEMKRRLVENFAKQGLRFEPLNRFPSNAGELASLRRAWSVSTGSALADALLDRWGMPVIETAAFLSVLAFGFLQGSGTLIALGVALKAAVFPALHLIPGALGLNPDAPTTAQAIHLFSLSAILTALYAGGYALLALAAVGPMPAVALAMIPVALLHFANNRIAALETDEARPLDLDTIDGLSGVRTSRQADQIAPPAPRAPSFRLRSSRAVLSGA